jgi:hypothetical protein
MLVFPSLGSQAEVSQDGFELRMSVEHHNVPGIPRQVNTFLKTLRTHTANKQVVSGQCPVASKAACRPWNSRSY